MTPSRTHDTGSDAVAVEVARLFFDRGLSKVQIGARLGMSRFRVARLLARARSAGLVRIEYGEDVTPRDRAAARALETRYGLDLCVVAADAEDPLDATARLAAEIVSDLVAADEWLGVAWGSTLAATARHLPVRRHPSLTVVPLAGGSLRLERDRAPAELARAFADRLGGVHRELYAPAIVGSPELRDALAREAEVATVLGAYDRLTTAVIGIGAWTSNGDVAGSSLLASGALPAEDVAALRARGAVGELVVHPFDADGQFVAPDLARRSLAVSLERLRAVPRLVAVAAGAVKADALRGILATGMLHVLVTDAAAAWAVIRSPARP